MNLRLDAIAVAVLLAGTPCAHAAEPVSAEHVLEAPGVTKDEIFTRTQLWIAETFRSAKDVVELSDRDAGVIVGNAIIEVSIGFGVKMPVRFMFRVDVRDERFRIRFSDVLLLAQGQERPIEHANRGRMEPRVLERFQEFADHLKAYVAAPADDDW